jgi:hypothetical protein
MSIPQSRPESGWKAICVRFGLWCMAVLLFGPKIEACAQEYSVNGLLEVTTKTLADSPGKTNKFEFSVQYNAGRYKIRTWRIGDHTNYHEYTYNDGVMYSVHHLTKVDPSRMGAATMLQNQFELKFPTLVEEREIPPNNGSHAQYLWFAYASHKYFAGLTDPLMPPIWSPEDPELRRQPFDIATFPVLSQREPQLPMFVSFVNDGYYRSYNPASKSLDVIPLQPPYDQGYTNAVYQALSVTNLNNLELPGNFVFAVYSTPLGSSRVPFERVILRGTTTSVHDSAPSASTLPELSGVASVADYRLGGEVAAHGATNRYSYAGYAVSNSQWLDHGQLAALRPKIEARAKIKLMQAQKARTGGKVRAATYICLVAVMLAPVFWIFWRMVRRKASENSER